MWHSRFLSELLVEHLMTRDLVTLTPGQSLPLAGEIMRLGRIRHIPVVSVEGRLEGLVTHRDVLRAQLSALTPLDDQERSSLQDVIRVSTIMHTNVWTVAPTATARAAARMLHDHRFGCLPVVEDGILVGIVTEADFLRVLAAPEKLARDGAPEVGAIMSACPVVVYLSTTLGEARALMRKHEIRHLPIVNPDHEPLGLLSDRDLKVAEAIAQSVDGADSLAVGLVGSEPPFVVERSARLDATLLDMASEQIGSAVVVEHGKVVGIVTATDACEVLGLELRGSFPLPEP